MASLYRKSIVEGIDSPRQFYSSMPSIKSDRRVSAHELQPISNISPAEVDTSKVKWRSLFNFTTRGHLPHLFITLIITVVSALIPPAAAIIYGKIFTLLALFGSGNLSGTDTLSQVSVYCLALAIVGLTSWVVELGFLSCWMTFGELQARAVRKQMFASMLEKDMDWYDMRQDGIDTLLIRIETQIRELQLSVSQPLGWCIYEICVSCAAMGVGLYYSWKLVLVILAMLPILALALTAASWHLGLTIEAQKRELDIAAKYTNTTIANINTVKAYNGQDHEIWQYFNTAKRVAKTYMIQARANALQFGFIKCATVGLFISGFWYGLVLVNQGLEPGAVYTTFYTCLTAMLSVETVLPQWLVLTKGKSAGHTLKRIIEGSERDETRKIGKMAGSVAPDICSGDIEITNVSFSYPSNVERSVMSDVNFFFPANETTYIVGRSGSGKSTVGNLLMRYYDFQKGDILIDGHAIQTLNVDWLRENITLVQQQSVLFNESVLQNIAFGRKTPATRDEILEAAHTADLEQTLDSLPNGLDTIVGSTGKSLSGGQQQRVALARARLRDSPIVILDEATSALDQRSRAKVMDRIREWRKGKTTIIITHDVSRIMDDEYVYVLGSGIIMQEGYRKTLAEKKYGLFYSFLPAVAVKSPRSPLWEVEPPTPSTGIPETGLPEYSELYADGGMFSRLLGRDSGNRSSYMGDNPFSLGSGAFRHSMIDAVEHWITPEMPEVDVFPSNGLIPKSNGKTPVMTGTAARKLSVPPFSTIQEDPDSPFHDNKALTEQSYPSASRQSHATSMAILEGHVFQTPNWGTQSNKDTLQPPLARLYTSSVTNSGMSKTQHKSTIEEKRQSRRNSRPTLDNASLISISLDFPTIEELDTEVALASKVKAREKKSREAASLVQIIRTIWPMLLPRARLIFVLGFLASFIVAVATPAFAYILAQLMSVYWLPLAERAALAKKWALILIAIALVDGLATFCSHLALEYAAQQWINGLRVEALKRILAQPKSWFDQEKNSADRLSECLDRCAEEMRNLVGRFMGPLFISSSLMSITIVWCLVISWKLTLVAVACFPVVFVSTRVYNWVTTKWERRCNTAATNASSIFSETMSSIRVVRALTLEKHFEAKHEQAVTVAWKAGVKRATYSGFMYGNVESLAFLIIATIFRYGAVQITNGQTSLTGCLQVINLLLLGIGNASALLNTMPQINSARTTATQMLYLAQLPRGRYESEGKERVISPFPVEFKDVSFTYPNRTQGKTLDKINLKIEKGTCTAIVGPSGSGKSTIASLLLGLYPPDPIALPGANTNSISWPTTNPHNDSTKNTLSFASTPITTLNLHSLRSHLSIVAQQPLLFPTTIYLNIVYGLAETSPYLSIEAAMEAARDAGIHDFIASMSQGYETKIGPGGIGISGGQAQRIVIARALVRKPKILILDEATSALDKVSADAIRDCIVRIMQKARLQPSQDGDGTSVVVISHDVEMMRICERMVVIEDGKVVEMGSFKELERGGEVFREVIGVEDRVVEEEEGEEGEGSGLGIGMGIGMTPVKARSKGSWSAQGGKGKDKRNGVE